MRKKMLEKLFITAANDCVTEMMILWFLKQMFRSNWQTRRHRGFEKVAEYFEARHTSAGRNSEQHEAKGNDLNNCKDNREGGASSPHCEIQS
jgi:hypothetical protein